MKKISTIFERDRESKLVLDRPNPDCNWVFKGIGIVHQKIDGTSVLLKKYSETKTLFLKRRVIKVHKKTGSWDFPKGFREAQFDAATGKRFGWVPVDPCLKEDKYHIAVLTFRFFDIYKPWPISLCDKRVRGGLGIMLDDILAGVISCATLHGIVAVVKLGTT